MKSQTVGSEDVSSLSLLTSLDAGLKSPALQQIIGTMPAVPAQESCGYGSTTFRVTIRHIPMIGWLFLLIAAFVAHWWLRARLRDLNDALAQQQRTIDALARRLEAAERAGVAAPRTGARRQTGSGRGIAGADAERKTRGASAIRLRSKSRPGRSATGAGYTDPRLRRRRRQFHHRRLFHRRRHRNRAFPSTGKARRREAVLGGRGIALVLAAVFFLRYSIDRGWLAPAVRVAIGIIVAIALLVVCELQRRAQYRVTANALDAAAIAILFATFFAAHALWNLIPATVTFALLALVTVLAVLLSIRHDSIFIAVLGLLGGFATPALLSTGENRPIPLFAYLLLLNVGLAWVAVRKKWPVLTILTLVLTTALPVGLGRHVPVGQRPDARRWGSSSCSR